MGKLFVIEGVDSSGKETQTKRMYEKLKEQGENVMLLSFPDYDSDFCLPVKRYLAGDLGDNPDDVNAYAASSFYAVDRYASFKMKWGEFYNAGGTIICDRYVTSNIVHQAMKIHGDKTAFMDWLEDFEYKIKRVEELWQEIEQRDDFKALYQNREQARDDFLKEYFKGA